MRKIILLSLALVLCGCAVDLKNIKSDYAFNSSSGKNIVIGKIYFREFRNLHKQVFLSFGNKDDKKDYNLTVREGAFWQNLFSSEKEVALYFFAELPAGEYEVNRIATGEWNIYYPQVKFRIIKNTGIYYIGTLEIIKSGETNVWTMRTPLTTYILDEYEEAAKEFKSRYPNIKEEIKIDLMEISK